MRQELPVVDQDAVADVASADDDDDDDVNGGMVKIYDKTPKNKKRDANGKKKGPRTNSANSGGNTTDKGNNNKGNNNINSVNNNLAAMASSSNYALAVSHIVQTLIAAYDTNQSLNFTALKARTARSHKLPGVPRLTHNLSSIPSEYRPKLSLCDILQCCFNTLKQVGCTTHVREY